MTLDTISLACEVATRYKAESVWLSELRIYLRPRMGRRAVKLVRLRPEAGPYLATIRVMHAINMAHVAVALGSEPQHAAEDLMRIVYDRSCPSATAGVRSDAFAVTAGWFTLFQGQPRDEYQFCKHTLLLFRRILEGLPETPDVWSETDVYIGLLAALVYEHRMADVLRDTLG